MKPRSDSIAPTTAPGHTPLGLGQTPSVAPAEPPHPAHRPFDVQRLREDFPILSQRMHGRPLVYLDNAATTQKPRQVIDAIENYYRQDNANIHRGVYALSQHATMLHEEARRKIQRFINAPHAHEIIFTRSATESINLVASSFGRAFIKSGDEILLTGMEHHSNIVPWQLLAESTGAKLKVVPFDDRGELIMEEYERRLSSRTKIVAVVHVSNALGTINPIKQIIELAHGRDIPVLVDGAQWVAHARTDVQAFDCDFYAFSGHKMFGPTGIGVLYGKSRLLEAMPPYQGGGDMISSVTFAKTTYNDLPYKFEAGTPHIAGAVGLGAAVDYLESVGMDAITNYERDLMAYASEKVATIEGLRMIGTARQKAGVLSFILSRGGREIHPHDIGQWLDSQGIAIRTGHHCCQPVMDRYDLAATARASLALYNTREEIDALAAGIRSALEFFA